MGSWLKNLFLIEMSVHSNACPRYEKQACREVEKVTRRWKLECDYCQQVNCSIVGVQLSRTVGGCPCVCDDEETWETGSDSKVKVLRLIAEEI